MSLLYEMSLATFRRDWDALDRLVIQHSPSLDVCRARSAVQGESLDALQAPDPMTMHDVPLDTPGMIVQPATNWQASRFTIVDKSVK